MLTYPQVTCLVGFPTARPLPGFNGVRRGRVKLGYQEMQNRIAGTLHLSGHRASLAAQLSAKLNVPAPETPAPRPVSQFKKSPVTARNLIFDGGEAVTQVTIASYPHARMGERTGRPYRECKLPVRGGNVLIFLFGLPDGLIDEKKVNATLQIFERVHEDGVKTLYANCEVLKDQAQTPALQLVAHSVKAQFVSKPGTKFYRDVPQNDGPLKTDGVLEVREYVPPKPRPARTVTEVEA